MFVHNLPKETCQNVSQSSENEFKLVLVNVYKNTQMANAKQQGAQHAQTSLCIASCNVYLIKKK